MTQQTIRVDGHTSILKRTKAAETTLYPIPRTALNKAMPDGREFVWGAVVAIHVIGPYALVEFLRDNSGTFASDMKPIIADHGTVQWHAYVDGTDTNSGYDSLEAALAGAIAYKVGGLNQSIIARSFMKALDADNFDDRNGGNLTGAVTPAS